METLSGEELRRLRWDTLPIHHGNRSHQLLMGVSHLVLDESLLSHTEGGSELVDFLNPQVLSALYERFVPAYFRRHHPGLRPTTSWVSGSIESVSVLLPGMHTDVVLTGPSRTLIIDMKCHGQTLEAHHDHKILSADNRNQTYGYVMHETRDPRQCGREVEEILLYAQITVDLPLWETWIEAGHRFHVCTLDPDQDFTGVASRLDEIMSLIKVV